LAKLGRQLAVHTAINMSGLVTKGQCGQRLKDVARLHFAQLSSAARCKKFIKSGAIRVNGEQVESARRVSEGETLTFVEEVVVVAARSAEDEKRVLKHVKNMQVGGFRCLAEDAEYAVVFKPAGFHTMGIHYRTMDKGLPLILTPSDSPDALPSPVPVHRLDARVCGVVLVAKTHRAIAFFGQEFEHRRVHKKYRALLPGKVQVDAAAANAEGEALVLDTPIADKACKSLLQVVNYTRSTKVGWLTTVDLSPHTGTCSTVRGHHRGHGRVRRCMLDYRWKRDRVRVCGRLQMEER
jgi:23S rRNA-/tRNA-specific pseudouridylate synthase